MPADFTLAQVAWKLKGLAISRHAHARHSRSFDKCQKAMCIENRADAALARKKERE